MDVNQCNSVSLVKGIIDSWKDGLYIKLVYIKTALTLCSDIHFAPLIKKMQKYNVEFAVASKVHWMMADFCRPMCRELRVLAAWREAKHCIYYRHYNDPKLVENRQIFPLSVCYVPLL